MKKMQSNQAGFTLIELVMVIVILGILAATALPRFVDLSTDAYTAAAQGFAGALNSANSVNYAGCAAKGFPAADVAGVCKVVTKCSDLKTLVNPNINFVTTLPDPSVAGQIYLTTDGAATKGVTSTCNAKYGNGKTGGVTLDFSVTGT